MAVDYRYAFSNMCEIYSCDASELIHTTIGQ